MYHSLQFNTLSLLDDSIMDSYNTYEDWFLVPTSRPVISMPPVKKNQVEIVGANGVLDLSYTLTNYPIYNNRTGSIEFAVLNDHDGYSWSDIYANIASSLHGRRARMYLEDDMDYYYEGQWALSQWTSNSDGTWSTVTLDYDLDPYRYYRTTKTFTKFASEANRQFQFTSDDVGIMPVVPTIIVSNTDSTGITLNLTNDELGISSMTKTITSNGTYKIYDLILSKMRSINSCVLTVYGSGQVAITFRKGDL